MNQQEKDATTNLIEQVQDSAINIIQPVLERTMVLAAEYAKASVEIWYSAKIWNTL
jgi:hypothetical protein